MSVMGSRIAQTHDECQRRLQQLFAWSFLFKHDILSRNDILV
jgi:hypothetical protein